jgi:hypothetical protein
MVLLRGCAAPTLEDAGRAALLLRRAALDDAGTGGGARGVTRWYGVTPWAALLRGHGAAALLWDCIVPPLEGGGWAALLRGGATAAEAAGRAEFLGGAARPLKDGERWGFRVWCCQWGLEQGIRSTDGAAVEMDVAGIGWLEAASNG